MGMLKRSLAGRGGPLLTLAALAVPAHAQIASGGDTVLFRSDAAGVRIEPQYEPRPLQWGPLLADLRLTARLVVDSNILRTSNGGADDVYFELAPSMRVLGSFGPHTATFSARASAKRFSRLVAQNNETVELLYTGRVDLGAGSFAQWRTLYAREIEPRASAGINLVQAGPAELQLLQSALTASTDFGRLGLAVSAGVVQRTFQPLVLKAGGKLDQSFRDTRSISIAPRASFGVAPGAGVFVAGSAVRTTSLDRQLTVLRDSTGYTLLAGVRTETEGLIVGEVGIGWRRQNYSNPVFRNFGGFTYDATVDWYPTRLISARVQLGQDIVNSGLPTVAGILRRSVAVNAYYDPLRNLRFSLALGREHDEFREIDFSTNTVSATLAGRYQIGRHLTVSAYGRVETRDTSDSNRLGGYDSVAIGVAVTGAL